MAKALYPTREQWEALRAIGLFDGGDVVLVRPNVADAMQDKHGLRDGDFEEAMEEYDFGGEPDLRVEVVAHPDHHSILFAKENVEGWNDEGGVTESGRWRRFAKTSAPSSKIPARTSRRCGRSISKTTGRGPWDSAGARTAR